MRVESHVVIYQVVRESRLTYPSTCWVSPSARGQIGLAPRDSRRLLNFFAGQQNFSYEESPRPNTAKWRPSKKLWGRPERRRLLHRGVIIRDSFPVPEVETTNTTTSSETITDW